jgi:hypothetical protein
MIRVLRVLPRDLVSAIAEGNGPNNLETAIRLALEGVNPGQRFAAHAVEALADPQFVPMMARVLVTGVAADSARSNHDLMMTHIRGRESRHMRRMKRRYGRNWWWWDFYRELSPELLEILEDEWPDGDTLVRVWLASGDVSFDNVSPEDRRRMAQMLMHCDSARDEVRLLLDNQTVSRATATRMRAFAPRVADFVATITGTDEVRSVQDDPYVPPRRSTPLLTFFSSLHFGVIHEPNSSWVLSWMRRDFEAANWSVDDVIGVVQRPELLAARTLMAILGANFSLGYPNVLTLVRHIDELSVRRAQKLGASLLRGEGLQSMNLAPEFSRLEPRYFPVSLFQAVAEAWQRAVAGATQ